MCHCQTSAHAGRGNPYPNALLQNHRALVLLRQAGLDQGQCLGKGQLSLLTGFHVLAGHYRDVDDEKLFANLKYFLERIMPVCNEYDIKMAIHPDDPAWSVFGLPRIIINKENILRMMKMVDDPHNGVTFCSGSYGTNLENDLPDMIRSLKGRIHFAHVRNLKFHSQQDFEEAAHLSSDGSFDMYEIMKALYDIGFDGPIRPDHGRMIWGEKAMPGYGLYDRALGATYLNGLWEAIDKSHKRGI